MEHVRGRILGALAIRRALGVVILATLVSALGYTRRHALYEQGTYSSAAERMWTAWFEVGAYFAIAGLIFVAAALLLGRPGYPPNNGH